MNNRDIELEEIIILQVVNFNDGYVVAELIKKKDFDKYFEFESKDGGIENVSKNYR